MYEHYRNIAVSTRKSCLVCGENFASSVFKWQKYPITELYISEKITEQLGVVDLELQCCAKCSHVQLKDVIDVDLQYGKESIYNFRTSQSITGRETTHFFTDFMKKTSGDSMGVIAEVGCNDAYLLDCLKDSADKLYGVDPILGGHESEFNNEKLTVFGDFFENVELPETPDIIICKDVVEHVADPVEFIRKLLNKSHADTLFYIQVPIIETILEDLRFDQIFHQHLNYYSVDSFKYMLEELDCHLVDFTINYDHWGAAIFAFKQGVKDHQETICLPAINSNLILEKYDLFKGMMFTTEQYLLNCDQEIYGYGAALMLAVLDYHLNGSLKSLKYIIDDDPSKSGKYYLQLPVEIKHSSEIKNWTESYILLTAISSRINIQRILRKLFELNPRKIINPLILI
jgi:hypothetical protein